jgi:hypothetical protein
MRFLFRQLFFHHVRALVFSERKVRHHDESCGRCLCRQHAKVLRPGGSLRPLGLEWGLTTRRRSADGPRHLFRNRNYLGGHEDAADGLQLDLGRS